MFNFPTQESWESFVNSLDLTNPQIALLVEECNLWRECAEKYYSAWINEILT